MGNSEEKRLPDGEGLKTEQLNVSLVLKGSGFW